MNRTGVSPENTGPRSPVKMAVRNSGRQRGTLSSSAMMARISSGMGRSTPTLRAGLDDAGHQIVTGIGE